jgi:hypothetical protein
VVRVADRRWPAWRPWDSRPRVGRVSGVGQLPPRRSWASSHLQNLASAYSRAITLDAVVEPVAAKLRVSTESLKKRLSASPVVDSPVFIVEAEASSPRQAVEIANAVSNSLTSYVTELNRSNPDSQRLFRAFQEAALRYQGRQGAEASAARAYGRRPSGAKEASSIKWLVG